MKTKNKGKIAILLAAVTLITASLSSCGAKHSYDAKDMYEIEVEGFNGMGTISARKNYDLFEIISEEVYDGIDEESEFAQVKLQLALEDLEIDTDDDTDELSNGDVIHFTVEFNEEKLEKYNVKLKGGEFDYTVEGLEEPKELDPFEGIEISYEGLSPNARIVIDTENWNDDAKDSGVNLFVEDTNGIANGDTITIEAKYNKEKLAKNGFYINKDAMDVNVVGVDEYLKDITGFDTTALDKKLAQKAEDVLADSYYKPLETIKTIYLTGQNEWYNYWEINSVNHTPVKSELWYDEDAFENNKKYTNLYFKIWKVEVNATKSKHNDDGFEVGDSKTFTIYMATSYCNIISSGNELDTENSKITGFFYSDDDRIGCSLDEAYQYYKNDNGGFEVVNKIM